MSKLLRRLDPIRKSMNFALNESVRHDGLSVEYDADITHLIIIENQTLYYTKKIAETENWNLQDIYSDEGKSGTSLRKRDAFKRMMRDAKDQKMDLIICASISRFARNFSDCMTQIAALKTMHPAHPIGVYFETENIYTLNPSSQYSLDIQALLADWESGNKSRRMILSYDQRIMTGQYPVADLMGYRHTKDGQLVIEPEEAKTVRFIFLAFIQGYNYDQITMILTQKKRSTLRGRQEWNGVMVANIMKNERRWGDLEARKSIVVDYKLGKVTKNNGNRCSAYVPEHHEAIVSPEIARAAHLVASSSKKCGVQDIVVIRQGALKGFVGIHLNWNGINAESIRSLCLSTYLPEEVAKLNKMAEIRSGKKLDMALPSDYLTVSGICFYQSKQPGHDNIKKWDPVQQGMPHPAGQLRICGTALSSDSAGRDFAKERSWLFNGDALAR